MARLKIDFPKHIVFRTQLSVRISDVNYGGHLGNDRFMSLAHEARVQFFKANGWTELDVDGLGISLADTAIVFKKELFYGDVIDIELMVGDLGTFGCDIYYRMIHTASGKDAAHAKTAIVFFNYRERKIAPMPGVFRERFSGA